MNCPTTCACKRHGSGNRVIHLPSQNNDINQMNPSFLSLGSALSDPFTSTAPVDGVNSPYANFVH